MTTTEIEQQAIDAAEGIGKVGTEVSLAIHHAVLAGGEPTRKVADALHGTWLGHPLHAVLTDVTVTDKNGNPVHGLPESAFRILDNNQPQTIASFEEHSGAPAPAAATMQPVAATKGVYSNEYLLHLPPVLSVVIIDIANLSIPEQMYLNY